MNESQLLIKIRSILDSQGLDAAKTALADLTKGQQDNAAAGAVSANQDAELAAAKNKLDRAAGAANASLNAMSATMRGDLQSAMQQILSATNRLDGAYAKLAAAGAGFAIGFKLGGVLDQTLGLSDAFAKLVNQQQALVGVTRLSNEELNKLAQTNLDALSKQFDSITTKAERLARRTAAAFGREEAGASAAEEVELAQAQIQPPGAERDAATAAIRAKFRDQRAAIEARKLAEQKKQAQSQLDQYNAQLATLDAEAQQAESDVATLQPIAQSGRATPAEQVQISNAMKRRREVLARRDAARERLAPQIEDLQSTLAEDIPAQESRLQLRQSANASRAMSDTAAVAKARAREDAEARLASLATQRAGAESQIPGIQSAIARERLEALTAARARDALGDDSSITGGRRRFAAGVTARNEEAQAAQAEKEGAQAIKGLVALIKQLAAAEDELRSQIQSYR
jgi:hypothetical protein